MGDDPYAEWWKAAFEAAEDFQMVCKRGGTVVAMNLRLRQVLEQAQAGGADGKEARLDQLLPAGTCAEVNAFFEEGKSALQTLSRIGLRLPGVSEFLADIELCRLDACHCRIVLRDVSRRQRLDAHAQRLVTAVDSSRDVVYLTDAEFRLTFVNAAFQSATGHDIEESIGQSSEFLYDPSTFEHLQECRARVRQGLDWVGLLLKRKADGTTYPVEAAISPIFDHEGRFTGAVVFERDLTVHLKLQGELLAERDLVRSVIDSFDSAVYVTDREFRLTHFNDGWRKLPAEQGWLNVSEPPRSGCSMFDFISDGDRRAELQEMFRQVLATGQAQELPTSSSNGGHWLTKVVPWRQGGEVRGLICAITDHSRFMELQNQLFQAQKMEIVGALTAGVAHDFNNLLQAITGNVDLLLISPVLDPSLRDRVSRVEKAAQRAAELTQQLLSFSRSSEDKDTASNLNRAIKEVAQLARRTSREKVHIVTDPGQMEIEVPVDETRLQQLLMNLCVNALDAMPNGGTLTLTTAAVPLSAAQAAKAIGAQEGQKFARCSVSDTGTGIPPEILPRIFETFFTSKEKGKGTGLGLGIVQNIINKHGGFIEVDSVVGKGTAFHVYLPLAQGAAPAAPARKDPKLKSGSGRILVVDDQELVLEFSKAFLSASGYSVKTVTSARAAIEHLEEVQGEVDLVLTDYSMPDTNGTELARQVKQRWPRIQLIIASGFIEGDVRQVIEGELGARVLDKPYIVEDATKMIAESIAQA